MHVLTNSASLACGAQENTPQGRKMIMHACGSDGDVDDEQQHASRGQTLADADWRGSQTVGVPGIYKVRHVATLLRHLTYMVWVASQPMVVTGTRVSGDQRGWKDSADVPSKWEVNGYTSSAITQSKPQQSHYLLPTEETCQNVAPCPLRRLPTAYSRQYPT